MNFTYCGRTLELFDHFYNLTILNERCVELAIARDWVDRSHADRVFPRMIEVGNVLGHYGPQFHQVIDQFEKPAWYQDQTITNEDLFNCVPPGPNNIFLADMIVSISTIEHIGTDYPSERDSLDAIHHMRSMLRPGGRMLITAPTGVSRVLDIAIVAGQTGATRSTTLTKHGYADWTQDDAPSTSYYGFQDHWAQTVWIGEFDA